MIKRQKLLDMDTILMWDINFRVENFLLYYKKVFL